MKALQIALAASLCAVPVAAQQPPRLEPVARIGCMDCEGPALFSGIQAVALDDGHVYVLDRSAPFVRVFTTSGRIVRAFGRAGSGPGELRLPIAIAPRPNGELEVFDMTLRRHTRYDTTGKAVRTRPSTGFTTHVASAPNATHVLLMQTDFTSPNLPILRMPDRETATVPLLTLAEDFPRMEPGTHFRTASLAAHPAGGFAVGDGIAEYRIRRFDTDGRPLGDIVRNIPKSRKTASDIAAEQERIKRNMGKVAEMARAEGGRPNAASLTPREERNHFNMDALAYDDTGRLWVRTERGGLNATVFDVFDARGNYTGEIRVPMRAGTFAVYRGLLAAKVMDEDDLEYVQLWRVR